MLIRLMRITSLSFLESASSSLACCRRSGLLSKVRNLCILVLVILLAYTAWPSIQYDSYLRFRLILDFIFNREAIAFIVESIKTGFNYHPIGRSVELLVIAVAIWKLIFKGKILAFLRVKSIVMLALASFWLYHRIDKKTPSLCRVEMNCLMRMTC